jgi:hypothetical protein
VVNEGAHGHLHDRRDEQRAHGGHRRDGGRQLPGRAHRRRRGPAAPCGGATCAASGSGNLNALVDLPSGAIATFTATGTVTGSGTLTNTATITAPGGITDPTPANNSATDNTAITPTADLSITKVLVGAAVPGADGERTPSR